jgi:colanic acid/amylovoran biosynthesis glycosyltransferase
MSRIIYITVETPFGNREEFFIPEMMEIVRQKHALLIVPRSPTRLRAVQTEEAALRSHSVYQPLFSWVILRTCISESLQNPLRCLRIFLRILFHSGNSLHLVKNLTIFPKALWLARLSRIWKAEHLHAHWASTTATMAMIAGEVTGIPWSFTAHRWDIIDNNMFDAKLASASFVRFISSNGLHLAQSVIKHNLPAKCQVIHMGVDLPIEHPPNERSNKKRFTIMCPATLLLRKGHEYLLKAVASLKARDSFCQLLIAGQGPMARMLELQVGELNIQDRVQFLGHLPHDKLLEYYKQNSVDLVVLASLDLDGPGEGIAVSLIEAMAYRIPVIASAVGGNPELIIEGTGILVPPKDSNALADSIERLIKDTQLRNKLAMAGYQRIKSEFNISNTVNSISLLIFDNKCLQESKQTRLREFF